MTIAPIWVQTLFWGAVETFLVLRLRYVLRREEIDTGKYVKRVATRQNQPNQFWFGVLIILSAMAYGAWAILTTILLPLLGWSFPRI